MAHEFLSYFWFARFTIEKLTCLIQVAFFNRRRREEVGEEVLRRRARLPTHHHTPEIKGSKYAARLGPLDSRLDCLQLHAT